MSPTHRYESPRWLGLSFLVSQHASGNAVDAKRGEEVVSNFTHNYTGNGLIVESRTSWSGTVPTTRRRQERPNTEHSFRKAGEATTGPAARSPEPRPLTEPQSLYKKRRRRTVRKSAPPPTRPRRKNAGRRTRRGRRSKDYKRASYFCQAESTP